MRPSLGIIGAGKVGQTLARLLDVAGYDVRAIFNPTDANALQLAQQINTEVVSSPSDVIAVADLTLLTVPDDAIEQVAQSLKCDDWSGKAVISKRPLKSYQERHLPLKPLANWCVDGCMK